MTTPNNIPPSVLETAFHLDSIAPVADPTGGNAMWYRYVITQGPNAENTITGTKSGSLNEVNIQLREMVERLNERFGKLQSKRK
jgi:hypothetical protein